ncbi:MAG: hypothetical protein DI535_09050 [Citrobacter freundii]|nr:MAG: hypothetical protein DI535_09050 [Citrobacter freundii]
MLPENQTPVSRPHQLFFCYNRQQKDILYTSIPLNIFFGSTAAGPDELPFFAYKEWQNATRMSPGNETVFSFDTGDNERFTCAVKALEMQDSTAFEALLMCTVTRLSSSTDNSLSTQFEEFIHLATHDLDAPLRKINLLTERLATRVGEDGADIVTRISANIKDMRAMIDGVAKLANANQTGPFTVVDPMQLISNETAIIRNQYPSREILLELEPIPALHGDAQACRDLFHELLENAVIFANNDRVFVSISATEASEEEKAALGLQNGTKFCKITIRDKGIGFAQEDAEKIFQPFVRLHGKSTYPGSGLGLAICKKIVENHFGAIYAEGTENEGARFILFLPQSRN